MPYIGNSPANVGNYQLIDDISSSFNGSTTSFALESGGAAMTPAKSSQLIINISGVMQQPDDSGTDGFLVNSTNIVFSSAPASTDTFWGVYQGQSVDIGTPSDDVVDTIHIKDSAVTASKLAAGAAVPSQSGHAGKYLTTDATNASWAALDTDANSTTKGLYEHAHTISANYSITSGNNAVTAGPITVDSGVSVTIPSGSTWVIV